MQLLEGIFSFIMGNLFLFIIAIGFITSMLGRSQRAREAQEKKGSPKQPNPTRASGRGSAMPSFGGEGPMRRMQSPVEQQSQPYEWQQETQRDTSTLSQPTQYRDLSIPSPAFTTNDEMSIAEYDYSSLDIQRATHSSNVSSTSSTNTAEPLLADFNADTARQGIIWAEIFGSPRSKRPYTYNRRT